MTELEDLRRELNSIDDGIAALFARRNEIVREVGLYKKHSGFPLNDPDRENAVTERIKGILPPLSAGFAASLMKTLFGFSKEIQKRVGGNYFVIGKKLPHSWSPEIYLPLGLDYGIKELPDEEAVKEFVLSRGFDGINVTFEYYIAKDGERGEKLYGVPEAVGSYIVVAIIADADNFDLQGETEHVFEIIPSQEDENGGEEI